MDSRRACAGVFLVAGALVLAAPAAAQSPDSLDATFGTAGVFTAAIGPDAGDEDVALAMARQSDGKFVLVGASEGEFAVSRHNTDGSLDTSFGGDGRVTTTVGSEADKVDEARAVAIQDDGMIVVAGFADAIVSSGGLASDFAVVRYESDGDLDTTFDGDGKVITPVETFSGPAFGMAIQPSDDKIVLVGRAKPSGGANLDDDFAVVRYNTNGSQDTGLDGDGELVTDVGGTEEDDEANAVAIQTDGKIVVGGYANPTGDGFKEDFAVARYNTDGSLDTGFDGDGKAITPISTGTTFHQDIANDVLIEGDGQIVLAGESLIGTSATFALARYNTDGSLDSGFDGDGKRNGTFLGAAHAAALQADGKIVVAGTDSVCGFDCDFAIARFTTTGALDSSFDGDGMSFTAVAPAPQVDIGRGLVIQPDGKPVIGGYADMGPPEFLDYDFGLVRYKANGDDTAPAAPNVTDTDPDSPANENAPEVKGTAEVGTTVLLYATSDCTGTPAASGSAATFASPGLTASVSDNTTTTFRARARDAAGNNSACSPSSVTYVEDSTPPATPTVTDTDPDSPANENGPEVKGTADASSTVKLYTNGSCTSAVAAAGSGADFAGSGLSVTVLDDSSTTFKATATDAAGNTSPCSPTSVTYVEDSTPPATPTVTDTDPESPANDNSPEVKGAASSGTVNVYTTADCTGTPVASGTAASYASPGLTAVVADNSSTTFRATAADTAGNSSACSPSSVTYVEDSTSPAAPTVTGTEPASPASDDTPMVKGTAEDDSTVSVHTSSDCSGAAAANGTAASFGSSGLLVSVPNDSTTTFRARAVDAAGNPSGCSASSVTYVEDSTAPETTIDSGPPDASTNASPSFAFSAPGAASFECRLDTGFAPCTSPAQFGPLPPGAHFFEVRATDVAGNTDPTPASRSFTVLAPDGGGGGGGGGGDGGGGGGGGGDGDGQDGPSNGNDFLSGDGLPNVICGLLGDDIIDGGGGDDTLFGDACNDTAKRVASAQTGTDGDDELNGEAGDDRLYGAGGDDVLKGGAGKDRLFGGGGADTLAGHAGNDVLDGGAGNDRLSGSTGTNRYAGGSGTDVVSARNGRKERVDCGSGRKDRATVDRTDKVKGCEKVKRPRR